MANPNYLWIRDGVRYEVDIAAPKNFQVDLLWKARTGNSAHGSDTAQALPAGDPRLLYDRPLAPQDISGALVKAIYINYSVVFANIPFLVAPGTSGQIDWCDAGWFDGVVVANSWAQGISQNAVGYPGELAKMVTEDWMFWKRNYLLPGATDLLTNDPAATINVYQTQREIKVDSQRRLHEWDDTVVYIVEPSFGRTINSFSMAWSALLDLPH